MMTINNIYTCRVYDYGINNICDDARMTLQSLRFVVFVGSWPKRRDIQKTEVTNAR